MHWVARRLQEHYNQHHWVSASAQFPLPGQQEPDHTQDALRSTDAFDPRVRESTDEVSAPWIRLIRYQLPEGDPPTNLMAKWLPYLYRGPVPEGAYRRFPPLNCALMTMLSEPEWRETATLQLFGTFDQCDVEILGHSVCTQEGTSQSDRDGATQVYPVYGISGVTVLFLAIAETRSAIDLLAGINSGGPIIADLMCGFGKPLLPEDRPSKRAWKTSVTSQAIARLCRRAFLAQSPKDRGSHRAAQLMRVWLSRASICSRLARSATPDRDALKELWLLFSSPAGFIEKDGYGGNGGEHSTLPDSYLGLRGVFYGCSIAAVATVSFIRTTGAISVANTDTSRNLNAASFNLLGDVHSASAPFAHTVSSTTHSSSPSKITAHHRTLVGERLSSLFSILEGDVKSSLDLVGKWEESFVTSFKSGDQGMSFYGHLARTIMRLLPDEQHQNLLKQWLRSPEHQGYRRLLGSTPAQLPKLGQRPFVFELVRETHRESPSFIAPDQSDQIIDNALSKALSEGEGPPASPWFFVSGEL